MEKLKLLNRHELKHDVEYMNLAKNLREAAKDGDKKAKKFMKLKMKHESKYEEEMKQEEELINSLNAPEVELNTETASPSVFHVVNFLTVYFVRFLPTAKCLGCQKKLVTKKDDDNYRPERSYCGHWMHQTCFEKFVNEPPFLRKCPADKCEDNFGSPTFKLDEMSVKSREKVYMQNQEKESEEDVLN